MMELGSPKQIRCWWKFEIPIEVFRVLATIPFGYLIYLIFWTIPFALRTSETEALDFSLFTSASIVWLTAVLHSKYSRSIWVSTLILLVMPIFYQFIRYEHYAKIDNLSIGSRLIDPKNVFHVTDYQGLYLYSISEKNGKGWSSNGEEKIDYRNQKVFVGVPLEQFIHLNINGIRLKLKVEIHPKLFSESIFKENRYDVNILRNNSIITEIGKTFQGAAEQYLYYALSMKEYKLTEQEIFNKKLASIKEQITKSKLLGLKQFLNQKIYKHDYPHSSVTSIELIE